MDGCDSMTIGEKIKRLRVERHITQETLAKHLNISYQAISKWEQNLTSPDLSVIPDIAGFFEITTDELLCVNPSNRKSPLNHCEKLYSIYVHSGTEEDFVKAASAYNEVILHGNPTSADLYYFVCLYGLHSERDLAKAIQFCHKIIKERNDNRDEYWFHTHTRLTQILVGSNKANEAIQFQKDWLEREPDNYLACASVAFAYHSAGDDKTAYEYIKRAEKMPQGAIEIDTGAGDICRNLKKYDEAHIYWDKAFEADTGSISCLFSKAGAYEETGEFSKAIGTYQLINDWLARQGYDSIEGVSKSEDKRIK
jgi:transcriptional regulator with XRE-family HTH domain